MLLPSGDQTGSDAPNCVRYLSAASVVAEPRSMRPGPFAQLVATIMVPDGLWLGCVSPGP